MNRPAQAGTARVVTASNRAAAGVYPDRTGPVIAAWLAGRGYAVTGPVVVPDGAPVEAALRAAVAEGVALVVTTGGTGLSPTDRTPEATRAVLDYEVPGLADAVRAAGLPQVPTAVLSRGMAGVAGRTLVVNLPGSTGGVKDGLAVLDGVLQHALDQISGGGDHAPGGGPATSTRVSAEAMASPGGSPTASASAHSHTSSSHTSSTRSSSSGSSVFQASDGHSTHSGAVDGKSRYSTVTDQPVSAAELAARVGSSATGAVVTFEGVVRDHDHGRSVARLTYEGHPTAGDVLAEVVADVLARHPQVQALAAAHRVGDLAIGDVALACAAATAHRAAAFAACADLVDEAKARLPIWKHQVFTDGTDEWVNCP